MQCWLQALEIGMSAWPERRARSHPIHTETEGTSTASATKAADAECAAPGVQRVGLKRIPAAQVTRLIIYKQLQGVGMARLRDVPAAKATRLLMDFLKPLSSLPFLAWLPVEERDTKWVKSSPSPSTTRPPRRLMVLL